MKKFIGLILAFMFLIPALVFAAPATMYVTVAGAGDNSGDSWANAMAYSDWETDCESAMEAGDTYYVAGGTYTLTSDMACTFATGTGTLPISIIGVKSGTTNEPPVGSDWAYGTDRPYIDGTSGYGFHWDDYVRIFNMRIDCNESGGCMGGDYNLLAFNDKCANAGSGSCLYTDDNSVILYSEGSSASGSAVNANYAYRTMVQFSYLHDSVTGVDCTNCAGSTIENNVIDTMSTVGILTTTGEKIIGNTFYNCAIGIDGNTAEDLQVVNNIFDNNTVGMYMDSAVASTFLAANIWSNNTTDVTNVTKGATDITSDISLTDPSNGDFTLPDSSVAEDAGLQVGTNTGTTGDYNVNIGADQTDTQTAGGGGTVSYGFSN